jgi:hypothetical protein
MQLEQNEAAEAARAVAKEIENSHNIQSEKHNADLVHGKDEVKLVSDTITVGVKESHKTDGLENSVTKEDASTAGFRDTDERIKHLPHEEENIEKEMKRHAEVLSESQETEPQDKIPVTQGTKEPKPKVNDDEDKIVTEEALGTAYPKDASTDQHLGTDEQEKVLRQKDDYEELEKAEEGVVRIVSNDDVEKLNEKKSASGASKPEQQKAEKQEENLTDQNHVSSSSPSVTNAVTSAINSVKKGSLVKDAVQGINKIIHPNIESKSLNGNVQDGKNENQMGISSDVKSDETTDAVVTDIHVIVNDIENVNGVVVTSEEQVDVDYELSNTVLSHESLSEMGMSNSSNATIDNLTSDDLKAAVSMVQMLSRRFPNAKCLDYLDFVEFKKQSLEAASQKGATSGEKHKLAVQKNEPIFKKLTDEIKGLQSSQVVYEQYIKAATSCYQRVILDLGQEVINEQKQYDHRMKMVEDEIMKLKEVRQHQMLSVEAVAANLNNIFEMLVAFIAETSPQLCHWCRYCKDASVKIAHRIMADERVEKVISVISSYKRDGCSFLFGIIFSCMFLKFRTNVKNTDLKLKKDKCKRNKSKQPRSKRDDEVVILHNTPSLHTDDDGSY